MTKDLNLDSSLKLLVDFLAGATSSGLSTTLFYPLEHIKTHLQLPGHEDIKQENLLIQIIQTGKIIHAK